MFTLVGCKLNCNSKHGDNFLFGFTSEDGEEEDTVSSSQAIYNVSLILSICKIKQQKVQQYLSKIDSVSLMLNNIDQKSIQYASTYIQSRTITALSLQFEQQFTKYKRNDLLAFFSKVQSMNLSSLAIKVKDDFAKESALMYRQALFEPLKSPKNCFGNLKELTLNFRMNQLSHSTLSSVYQAMLTNPKGNLEKLSLITSECDIEERCCEQISNIILHSVETLSALTIQIQNDNFENDHPINSLGHALSCIQNIQSIQLTLLLIQGELEQVSINLSQFFEGIRKNPSTESCQLSLKFDNVIPMACSRIGEAAAEAKAFTYEGLFSVSLATEMGIQIAKSTKLTSLEVNTESDEVALMLSYAVHFCQSIKSLEVRYLGKRLKVLRTELSLALQANQSIEQLTIQSLNIRSCLGDLVDISSVFNKASNLKSIAFTFNSGKAELEHIYQFFTNISGNKSIERIEFICNQVSSSKNQQLIPKYKKITQPLAEIPHLQEIVLGIPQEFDNGFEETIYQAKLLKELFMLPYVISVDISSNDDDINDILNDSSISFEIMMYFIITFEKLASPSLFYSPNNHIADLYF